MSDEPSKATSSHADAGPPRGIRAPAWFRETWLSVVNLVVPPRCAFCEVDIDHVDGEPLLCQGCIGQFAPSARITCRRCGAAVIARAGPTPAEQGDSEDPPGQCPRCRRKSFRFDGAVSLGPYRDELRSAVLRMKDRRNDHLAVAIGEFLAYGRAAELAALRPDVVVPIPMHWRRRVVRGTNSPEIMASRISRHLGVPTERAMLVRHRNTVPQADLSPTKRLENVRGAFRLGRGYDIKSSRILLIDDVMTTGATCNEAARVLKRAGAQAVFAAVAARTEPPRDGPAEAPAHGT